MSNIALAGLIFWGDVSVTIRLAKGSQPQPAPGSPTPLINILYNILISGLLGTSRTYSRRFVACWFVQLTDKEKYIKVLYSELESVVALLFTRYSCLGRHLQAILYLVVATVEYFSILVRAQGFEPWTNRLKVYCSTD